MPPGCVAGRARWLLGQTACSPAGRAGMRPGRARPRDPEGPCRARGRPSACSPRLGPTGPLRHRSSRRRRTAGVEGEGEPRALSIRAHGPAACTDPLLPGIPGGAACEDTARRRGPSGPALPQACPTSHRDKSLPLCAPGQLSGTGPPSRRGRSPGARHGPQPAPWRAGPGASARRAAAGPPAGRGRCRGAASGGRGARPGSGSGRGGRRRRVALCVPAVARRGGPGAARPGPAVTVTVTLRPRRGMAEAEAAGGAGEGRAAGQGPAPAEEGAELAAVIGATVPTGFELTAAEEVQEKLGSASRISRDRGKIYFEVPARGLPQVRAGCPPRSPGPSPAPPGSAGLSAGAGSRPVLRGGRPGGGVARVPSGGPGPGSCVRVDLGLHGQVQPRWEPEPAQRSPPASRGTVTPVQGRGNRVCHGWQRPAGTGPVRRR